MKIFNQSKLLTIDLDEADDAKVAGLFHSSFRGQTGHPYRLSYQLSLGFGRSKVYCPTKSRLPLNIHEFDVVIVEMKSLTIGAQLHMQPDVGGEQVSIPVAVSPRNLFDPKCLVLSRIQNDIERVLLRGGLVIIIAEQSRESSYTIETHHPTKGVTTDEFRYSTDEFLFNPQLIGENRAGKEIVFPKSPYSEVLNRYADQSYYKRTFNAPEVIVGREFKVDTTMVPLAKNRDGDVVGFSVRRDAGELIVLPSFEDVGTVIKDLLTESAPVRHPSLFPEIQSSAWLKSDPLYALPGSIELEEKKAEVRRRLEKELLVLDLSIEENEKENKWLHDLLTETSSPLVRAVGQFLTWAGFENVHVLDEKEEDIQIETDSGLIVIEVKGIGGTSTDAACGQISKIRRRREKERGKHDVIAVYIVNHQRHLPLHDRQNPPFSQQQITDAASDERGLLTTGDLYEAFARVSEGVLSKVCVRSALTAHGLCALIPSKKKTLGTPRELHQNGRVLVIELEGTTVQVGQVLWLRRANRWITREVLEIQVNGESVPDASDGEVGIRLSEAASQEDELWLCSEVP